ncbi:MAG: hypothetical protein ACK56I_25025, partial [bacterium]
SRINSKDPGLVGHKAALNPQVHRHQTQHNCRQRHRQRPQQQHSSSGADHSCQHDPIRAEAIDQEPDRRCRQYARQPHYQAQSQSRSPYAAPMHGSSVQ